MQAVLRSTGKVLAAEAWGFTDDLLVPAAMLAVIAVLATRDAVRIRRGIRHEGAGRQLNYRPSSASRSSSSAGGAP